jgi:hypothetical protein
MDKIFPGKKTFRNLNEKGEITHQWSADELNWKVPVVCGPCNSGWMSDIEKWHAKPSMYDLIDGKVDIPIPQSRARSMALFSFKTAIILDYMNRDRPIKFFPRSLRHDFRKTLNIPPTVRMWMAGFLPRGMGRTRTFYYDAEIPTLIEFYVCNFMAGRLVVQVVTERRPTSLTFFPTPGFEHLAIPFWPKIQSGFEWPAGSVLMNLAEFESFSMRWKVLTVSQLTSRR